jgi:thiol-disulfide isomerase/thioredoxin
MISEIFGAKKMSIHKVSSSAEIDAIIAKYDAVIVFFGSKSCPGCSEMLPVYQKLAKRYDSDIQFVYVDVDKAKLMFTRLPLYVFFHHHLRQGNHVGTGDDRLKDFVKTCVRACK